VSLARGSVAGREVAHHREFEHLALQSLDDEHDPDREKRQADYHANQHEKKAAERRDEKQREARDPEHRSNDQDSQTPSEALKRMEPHEAVLVIGVDEKEHDCRQKKVRQCAGERLGQSAHGALRALYGMHGAAAARTVSGGIGHLRGAVWTTERHVFEPDGTSLFNKPIE
jgi:hypothetical protein